jgi:hypothetical protein
MDATFHGGSNDTIGRRVRLRRLEISHRFVPFNFLLSLAAPHLHGVLVLVTGNKFIAGVIVTGDNCSPVSLSPAINLSPVSLKVENLVSDSLLCRGSFSLELVYSLGYTFRARNGGGKVQRKDKIDSLSTQNGQCVNQREYTLFQEKER